MEHESFEDEATAALMNELFVNVKVDREERPDLDALYMDAVVTLTGHGGWPMTVFLTPDGEPFYGGTYFPPEPRHGLPSFRQILDAVAEAYRERPADVARTARELVDAIRRGSEVRPSTRPAHGVDPRRGGTSPGADLRPDLGGFGGAPKFPPASALELLDAARRAGHGHGARSTPWPRAACTTWSAAAFTAIRSTSAGSSRTSRRCSTTTPCSSRRTSTAGS